MVFSLALAFKGKSGTLIGVVLKPPVTEACRSAMRSPVLADLNAALRLEGLFVSSVPYVMPLGCKCQPRGRPQKKGLLHQGLILEYFPVVHCQPYVHVPTAK